MDISIGSLSIHNGGTWVNHISLTKNMETNGFILRINKCKPVPFQGESNFLKGAICNVLLHFSFTFERG